MAMTNSQIILENMMILAMGGAIGPDEEIHTFQHWKSIGYSVKKGEKAVAKFPIWKMGTKKDEEGEEKSTGRMFLKNSAFFSSRQVEPIKAGA